MGDSFNGITSPILGTDHVERDKLMSALYTICKEGFSASDVTILEKLFVHIVNSSTIKDELSTLLPKFCEWLKTVMDKWESNELFYGVQIFTVRFVGYVGSTYAGFKLLEENIILDSLKKLLDRSEVENDSFLIVPMLNNFELFSQHQYGWNWVIQTGVWKYAVEAFYEDRSIYIRRESAKLMSRLLSGSVGHGDDSAEGILRYISEPLTSSNLLVIECGRPDSGSPNSSDNLSGSRPWLKSTSSESEEKIVKSAKYLSRVLEDSLLNSTVIQTRISIVYKFEKNPAQSIFLSSQNLITNNSEVFSSLVLMVELTYAVRDGGGKCSPEKCCFSNMHLQAGQIIRTLHWLKQWNTFINFCVTCVSWQNKLKERVSPSRESCSQCIEFVDSIVNSLSKLYYHRTGFMSSSKGMTDGDCKDNMHLTHMALSGIARIVKSIENQDTVEELCDDVLIIFENIRKEFSKPEKFDMIKPVLLNVLTLTCNLFELQVMSQARAKKGKERVFWAIFNLNSSICPLTSVNVRVAVTILQAVNKLLKIYYMSYLVHLFEKLDVRIPLFKAKIVHIYKHLASESWEVRDTALEVLQTMVELLEIMPYPLGDIFKIEQLITIKYMTRCDESAYVKASAMKFFSKSVRAKLFWSMVSPTELFDLGVETLLTGEEPVARQAACELLTSLYVTHGSKELAHEMDTIYETVYTASVKDFDWEVKKSALAFWQCTIDKLLFDMGVPVNLPNASSVVNEDMSSQITDVFSALGASGCLKAIWSSIDDCDIKVCQEAEKVINNIYKLDEQWPFISHILEAGESGGNAHPVEGSGSSKQLTPKEFFTLLQDQKWRQRVGARTEWIENTCDDLNSLLDDILREDSQMGDWDHNAIDCY